MKPGNQHKAWCQFLQYHQVLKDEEESDCSLDLFHRKRFFYWESTTKGD